jgi:hypothetical protein
VLLSMVLVHTFPQITEWLPDLIYGIAK